MQEAAPGDAEVKRGKNKGWTIKERQGGSSASTCYQELVPKGRVWNCAGGRDGENPAGSARGEQGQPKMNFCGC